MRDRRMALRRALGWLAAVAIVVGLFAGFGVAPREIVQGNVQRIMYIHVPSVLTAYLAFALVLIGSAAYLATRRPAWDRLAAAAAEIGVLFTGIFIASGSIWGKPTWGVWWTWDARLTSTAVLFLVYLGYLLLRAMVEDPEARARYSAIVGILGAINIPIVHFSVYWWRALHQPATILAPGKAPLSSSLAVPLLLNWVAFTLVFAYFLARRMEIARLEEEA
jgi:heme exporter protein C